MGVVRHGETLSKSASRQSKRSPTESYGMKCRLSVYLEPALAARLRELAKRKNDSMSLVAEAAIASLLTLDEGVGALDRSLNLRKSQADTTELVAPIIRSA
jgi:predicted transcriptional regulator